MRRNSQLVTGALIGGTFGAVFVLANAHTPLGDGAAVVFRILAASGLLAVCLAAGRARGARLVRPERSDARAESVNLFGRGFWLVVAGELILLGIGLAALRELGAPQQANVAWIALVVGLHFIAFRFTGVRAYRLTVPGALLTVFGIVGLGLAASSDPRWTSLISGVLSGFTLLIGSIYASVRELGRRRADDRPHPRTASQGPARRSDPARVR